VSPRTSSGRQQLMRIKAVLVGDSCVGKTCLMHRFTQGAFDAAYKPTVGVDYRTQSVCGDNDVVSKVTIWDAGGA
jgi:small GTP-binding protein